MGFALILIVGAIFGWLGSILLQCEGRRCALLCTAAGMAGSVLVAAAAGPVPLFIGVGGIQLVWGAFGASLAIVVANLLALTMMDDTKGKN